MGLGMGATMMPLFTSALKTLKAHEVARGSTLLNITQQIASSVGVAIMSVLLTNHLQASKLAGPAMATPAHPGPGRQDPRGRDREGAGGRSPGVRRHLLGGVGDGAADGDPGDVPAAQARGDAPARRRGRPSRRRALTSATTTGRHISSWVSGSPPNSRPSGSARPVIAAISSAESSKPKTSRFCALALGVAGLRDRERAELDVPAQDHLAGRDAVPLGRLGRPRARRAAPAACPSGSRPRCGCRAARGPRASRACGKRGCSSIWFTDGRDAGVVDDPGEVLLGEVGDADRADQALLLAGRPAPATPRRTCPTLGFGQWIEVQVEVVEAEPLERAADRGDGVVVPVVAAGQLARRPAPRRGGARSGGSPRRPRARSRSSPRCRAAGSRSRARCRIAAMPSSPLSG